MPTEKMYYREKIVDGIICCKGSEDGEWIPLSPEKMTKKILKMQVEIERLTHKLEVATRKVHDPI